MASSPAVHPPSPASLHFAGVSKSFGHLAAVRDVHLNVPAGQTCSLLGPSGCGKTTLLRMAAGFVQPDQGAILLDGTDVTHLPPERRAVNTVFQHYALFPHLNVRDNVAFSLTLTRQPANRIRSEVDRLLELVDLTRQASHWPHQLSGGQKQRVGIARALANQPRVLLLDEPLAALDLKLRQRLLLELQSLHNQIGTTFLYVTHDQQEAMSISDAIAVMHNGRIEQIGTPHEVYHSPQTSFVASFIGDTNFLDGVVRTASHALTASAEIEDFGEVRFHNHIAATAGDRIRLSIRPELWQLSTSRPDQGDGHQAFPAVVEEELFLGSSTRTWLRCGNRRVFVDSNHPHRDAMSATRQRGCAVWLHWHPSDAWPMKPDDAGTTGG